MPDLITNARAIQNPLLAAMNASNPTYLASLISTASDQIIRYCHREFVQTSYVEYRNGGIYPVSSPMLLRQYPVQSVTRVASAWRALLVNNVGGTYTRATVQTIPSTDGLSTASVVLTSVSAGVPTTTTLLATSYPTINQLAAAINAVPGWSTAVQGGANGSYGNYPTADLKTYQGATTALFGGAYLELYDDIGLWQSYPANGGMGECDEGWPGLGYGWRLDPETGEMYGKFPRGQLNIRIDYTAGYATIPQGVQEACIQLILYTYQSGMIDYSATKIKVGPFMADAPDPQKMVIPPNIRTMLDEYRAYDRTIAR